MPSLLLKGFRGLWSNTTPLMRPEGYLTAAHNCVCEVPGIVGCRRGWEWQSRTGTGSAATHVALYTNAQLAGRYFVSTPSAELTTTTECAQIRYGTTATTTGTLSGLANPLDFSSTSIYRPQFVAFDGFPTLYFTGGDGTSADGVTGRAIARRIENPITGTPLCYPAGMPRATHPMAGVHFAGTVMPNNTWADYRVCFRRRTADGQEIRSAPSPRYRMNNVSGGALNPTVVVTLPLMPWGSDRGNANHRIQTTYVLEVYRTAFVTSPTVEPIGDFRLVYEKQVTSADLVAVAGGWLTGYIAFSDTASEAFRLMQPQLYTDPTHPIPELPGFVNGDKTANGLPPGAKTVATWKNRLWLGDTTEPYALNMTLVAANVGGESITVGGRTYVAQAAAIPPLTYAYSALAGVTENLRETVANLCYQINGDANQTTVWAFPDYSSGAKPGSFWLVERLPGVTQFSVTFAVGADAAKFRPYNPNSGTFQLDSSRDAYPNGLAWSKPGQPDAFPPVCRMKVGPNGSTLMAIQPLGDALYLFTSAGLYRLTGSDELDFGADTDSGRGLRLFDAGCQLLARNAVAVCDEAIYAYCTNGIARIDASGVTYISEPIKDTLTSYWENYNTGAAASFATVDPDAGNVFFHLTQQVASTTYTAQSTYVYNTRTQAWTTHGIPSGMTWTGACWNPVSRRVTMGFRNTSAVSAVGGIAVEYDKTSSGKHYDRTPTAGGTDATIIVTIGIGAQMPAGLHAVHWQDCIVSFKGSTSGAHSTILFGDDFGTVDGYTSLARSGTTSLRTTVPTATCRSMRLTVTLYSEDKDDWFQLEAVELTFRGATRKGATS